MAHGGEPSEISVEGGNPAAVFYGDRTEDRIGNKVAGGIGLFAQSAQQHQVAAARTETNMPWLGAGGLDEGEGVGEGRWDREDPAVRCQAQK